MELLIQERKQAHLDAVLKNIQTKEEELNDEKTKNKTTNLVLATLQEEKQVSGWTAFAKASWSKSRR